MHALQPWTVLGLERCVWGALKLVLRVGTVDRSVALWAAGLCSTLCIHSQLATGSCEWLAYQVSLCEQRL